MLKTYEIKRGVNLQMGVQGRITFLEDSKANVLFLINNSHKLVHVVLTNELEGHFRSVIPSWLKGVSDAFLQRWILRKFNWLLVASVTPISNNPPAPEENDFTTERSRKSYLRIMK